MRSPNVLIANKKIKKIETRKNLVRLSQIRTEFLVLRSLVNKSLQICKYFAQASDCMIEAFRNSDSMLLKVLTENEGY